MVCRSMNLFFPKLELFLFLAGMRIRKALLFYPPEKTGAKK